MHSRGLGVWGATLVLAACTTTVNGADDEKSPGQAAKAPPAAQRSWFGRWFGDDSATEKAADTEQCADVQIDPDAPAPRPTALDNSAALRARAQATLLRRQSACLKLKEIARQLNDRDLERLADTLDERAWQAYSQKTAGLSAAPAEYMSDEATLGRRLGPPAGAARLTEGRPAAAGRETDRRASRED